MNMRIFSLSKTVCLLLLSIFFLNTCDLFTGISSENLIDKIDEEIAWENAAKVVVTVDFPPEWGTSRQEGVGNCGDTREGYSFEVGFSPSDTHAFLEWRAYLTSSLDRDWHDDPEAYLEKIVIVNGRPEDNPNAPEQIKGVIMPKIGEHGGTGQFTVNISQPVTLIPFSREQPRIIRSSPPMSSSDGVVYHSRARPIQINFAGPLRASTAVFNPGYIQLHRSVVDDKTGAVTGRSEVAQIGTRLIYYDTPEYESDLRQIIINPIIIPDEGIGPPSGSEFDLEFGTRFVTSRGASWKEPVKLIWRTRHNTFYIGSWTAEYVESTKEIVLSWEQGGEAGVNNVDSKLRFKTYSNGSSSSEQEIPLGPGGPGTKNYSFEDILPFALSGDIGICYEIWIDLNYLGESFPMEEEDVIRIWNIPGMTTSSANPALPVRNQADLARMADTDPYGVYVLDNNIDIIGSWTPVGTGSKSFKGTFYGLGKEIRFNRTSTGFSGYLDINQYVGLFGLVDGAKIQDITVRYEEVSLANDAASDPVYIGGIAGYAAGETVIKNTVVSKITSSGTLHNNLSRINGGVFIGGIFGYASNKTEIDKTIADINLRVEKNNAGDIYSGGLVGTLEGEITNSYALGNINIDGTTTNSVRRAGGLVGYLDGGALSYSFNKSDLIEVGGGSSIFAGGITGQANGGSIRDTVALGSNITATGSNVYRILGGGSATTFTNNYALGSMVVDGTDTNDGTNTNDGIAFVASGVSAAFSGFTEPVWISTGNLYNSTGPVAKLGHPLLLGMSPNIAVKWKDVPSFTITPSVSPDNTTGTIVGPTSAEPGATVTFTAVPTPGYQFKAFSVRESIDINPKIPAFSSSGTSCSFVMPNYNVTVSVVFEKITYTINWSPSNGNPDNGTFAVSTADGDTAEFNDVLTVTATPNTGYKVATMSVTGLGTVSNGWTITNQTSGAATYTFNVPGLPLNTVIQIGVTFEKRSHAINWNPAGGNPSNGTFEVTADNGSTVEYNQSVTITATPNTGYKVATMSVAGQTIEPNEPNSWNVSDQTSGVATYTFNVPALALNASIQVGVTFEKRSHTINWSPSNGNPDNGTFAVSTANGDTAEFNDVLTVTATPNTGYKVATMTATGSGWSGWSVTNPSSGNISHSFNVPGLALGESVTVGVTFEKEKYQISTTQAGSGTISISGDSVVQGPPITAEMSNEITINLTPSNSPPHRIQKVRVYETANSNNIINNIDHTKPGGNNFTFNMPAYPVTINVDFVQLFDITQNLTHVPSGTTGGSITGLPANAAAGDVVNFTVNNASPSYRLESGSVDVTGGVTDLENTSLNNYEFTMPANAVTVKATFECLYNITSGTPNGGTFTVSPSGVYAAAAGDTITVNTTPDEGYQVQAVTVNGLSTGVETITANERYTFPMPASGITVNVTFEKITYTVSPALDTPTTVTGGTFTVTGIAQIGNTITVNTTPAGGYRVRVGGVTVTRSDSETPPSVSGSGNSYSFTMPASNITVNVEFEKITYTISWNPTDGNPGNGTFTVTEVNGSTVEFDQSVTITATPDIGYQVATMTVTGLTIEKNSWSITDQTSGTATYTFNVPALALNATILVGVTFEKRSHTINWNPTGGNPGNGTFDVRFTSNSTLINHGGTAQYNDEVIITARPEIGYEVAAMTVTGFGTFSNGWIITNNPSSGAATYTFNVPALALNTPIEVGVTFEKITHTVNTSISIPEGGEVELGVGSAGTNATVSAQGGDTVHITANPNSGWKVTNITWRVNSGSPTSLFTENGEDISSPKTGSFTMGDYISGTNITVNVTFAKITYTVTPTLGSQESVTGGTFTVTGIAQVDEPITVTANPATANGYRVMSMTYTPQSSGAPQNITGSGDTRTFPMPADDITVNVVFSNVYSITRSGTGATGIVNLPLEAAYGTEVTFTVNRANNTKVGDVTVTGGINDGQPLQSDATGGYRFTMLPIMPAENVTVSVASTTGARNITLNNPGNNNSYTVKVGNHTVTVPIQAGAVSGDQVIVTANPANGWQLVDSNELSFAGNNLPDTFSRVGNTLTFEMSNVNNNGLTITVNFEEITSPSSSPIPSFSGSAMTGVDNNVPAVTGNTSRSNQNRALSPVTGRSAPSTRSAVSEQARNNTGRLTTGVTSRPYSQQELSNVTVSALNRTSVADDNIEAAAIRTHVMDVAEDVVTPVSIDGLTDVSDILAENENMINDVQDEAYNGKFAAKDQPDNIRKNVIMNFLKSIWEFILGIIFAKH